MRWPRWRAGAGHAALHDRRARCPPTLLPGETLAESAERLVAMRRDAGR